MSVISQLLPNRFWQNFKRRFLGSSWIDSKCQNDICPGNICPCNICPYQDYISCYWLDCDQTSKVGSLDHLWQMPAVIVTFVQATFVLATFVLLYQNFFCHNNFILKKIWTTSFSTWNVFQPKIFLNKKFFTPKKIAGPRIFWDHNLTSPRSDPFLKVFRLIIDGIQ